MGPDPVPSKQSDWSDTRCTGRQHSKRSILKHSCYLTRSGICTQVRCRSDPHPSQCLTRFWCSTNIEESRYAFVQITMNPSMSCFQTKLHENMFQFRADLLEWFSVSEEFRNQGMNTHHGTIIGSSKSTDMGIYCGLAMRTSVVPSNQSFSVAESVPVPQCWCCMEQSFNSKWKSSLPAASTENKMTLMGHRQQNPTLVGVAVALWTRHLLGGKFYSHSNGSMDHRWRKMASKNEATAHVI